MERIYVFLIRNDVWIYIICGLGLIWYAGELWRARRALRGAIFALERERGEQMRRSALTAIVLLVSIAGFVTYVNFEVAPSLPAELLKPPTPTPDIFATPLSSPTSLVIASSPSPPVAPTVTLRPQSNPNLPQTAGTPFPEDETRAADSTPTSTRLLISGSCPPETEIISPPSDVEASGSITLIGTAAGDNFGSFVLEAAGPQSEGRWVALQDEPASEPVIDGILGTADMTGWIEGDYGIRLLVRDRDGEEVGECTILITLSDQDS